MIKLNPGTEIHDQTIGHGRSSRRKPSMRTGFAAALISFLFSCVTPALAENPSDARLVADVTVAKSIISLLQSRDFTAIRAQFHPVVGPVTDVLLARMADVIAGEPTSIETISSSGRYNVETGNGNSRTILEYEIGPHWIVADAVVNTENNVKLVSGLHFAVNDKPLRELNAFHLGGKGFAQYAFLACWMGIIGLTGYAMITAFRRQSGWRRWLLIVAMPLGLTPTVAMNWNTAQSWILEAVTVPAGSSFPIFAIRFPMALFGNTETGTPYLYISAPLIAVGYLIWRCLRQAPAASRARRVW